MIGRVAALLLVLACAGCGVTRAPQIATPEQAIASKTDLWGEAALKQPGGPSYAFFERLLPPLRYVDADFRHYPIPMSAPAARVKGRLVSNGSAINALARQPNWKNEAGTPVHVLVGAQREAFGSDLSRLDGPKLLDGYLPIVQLHYRHGGGIYGEEVFAAVDPALTDAGAVLAKFDFPAHDQGRVELRFESGYEMMPADGRVLRDPAGKAVATFDDNWEFSPFRSSLTSKPTHAASAAVMIFTAPTSQPVPAVDAAMYAQQRDRAIQVWRGIADGPTKIITPEPLVNNAARALLVQQYEILADDQLNYSASNQYARKYAYESGDAARSLLCFGHADVVRKSIPPLFVYRRPNIEYHDGAFKLQLLADYFFVTRDATLIAEIRPLWQREIDLILDGRKKGGGLLPREKYCSDIDTPVRSLKANANCWRGLRDMSLVLDEIGDHAQAAQLAAIAAEYRTQILAAMEKAIVRTIDPPFVPIALDGEEPPPNPITSTRMGSYWNLIIPGVLWCGIFPIDSEPADAIVRYVRENGGLCMGLTRVQSARGVWTNVQNIDDLYGLRYQLALLKRDEVDRALVGFYAKLAQGMTRDTFIDGESTGIVPLDRFGRQLALPPNSAANANFLIQLRHLLVQDWDMDYDGRADTLRLAFATPRAWLRDGERIEVNNAPTAFGEVSYAIESGTFPGIVVAEVKLPQRQAPDKVLLRLRLPDSRRV
ncbi:MAG: hypothetical protein QOE14_273, partial [Humisphaera sp.]|nr:hypothetical protein [Humisphaera sp.]